MVVREMVVYMEVIMKKMCLSAVLLAVVAFDANAMQDDLTSPERVASPTPTMRPLPDSAESPERIASPTPRTSPETDPSSPEPGSRMSPAPDSANSEPGSRMSQETDSEGSPGRDTPGTDQNIPSPAEPETDPEYIRSLSPQPAPHHQPRWAVLGKCAVYGTAYFLSAIAEFFVCFGTPSGETFLDDIVAGPGKPGGILNALYRGTLHAVCAGCCVFGCKRLLDTLETLRPRRPELQDAETQTCDPEDNHEKTD
jgi:hypothetical protein